MTPLIVTSIILTHVVSQQVLLYGRSFSDKKFVNLENWNLYQKNPLKSGFGSLTIDDDDYAGLYSITGASYQTYLIGIYQIFQGIPPHSILIIKAKTLMSNYGLGGTGVCNVRADGSLIIQITNNLDPVNNYKINSFEVSYQSSSPAVIIEFHFQGTGDFQSLTFGFREFELHYKTCPAGCAFCKAWDVQQSFCNLWSLDYRTFFDQSSLNEGWKITSKSNNLYRMEYCQDDKILNLIGLALPTESIEKTLILSPHYKILIQYKLFLFGGGSASYYYFYQELNDLIVKEIQFSSLVYKASQICKYNSASGLGDYVQFVKYENIHYNTIEKFRIFTQGRTYFQKIKWSIIHFEVYIKKCHPDCTESCSGPKADQCTKIQYPKFQSFISYFTDPLFTNTQDWQMINPIQPKSPNYCNSVSIFGGYLQLRGDHYIQRIVTLKDHQTIQISFKFYQIDNFNNDILYVVLDDIIIYQTVLEPILDQSKAALLCGIYENYDLILKISTPIIQHTQQKSIIQIYTNQPTTSLGYWGIRDFYIKLDSINYVQELKDARFSITDWLNFPWTLTKKIQTIETCKNQNYIISNQILNTPSTFRKIIKNIPTHQKIRVQFMIILTYTTIVVDTIQMNFSIDQNENKIIKYLKLIDDQYCETLTLSKAYNFDDIITHSIDNLFIELSIDNTQINWGIRDFYLSYSNS